MLQFPTKQLPSIFKTNNVRKTKYDQLERDRPLSEWAGILQPICTISTFSIYTMEEVYTVEKIGLVVRDRPLFEWAGIFQLML